MNVRFAAVIAVTSLSVTHGRLPAGGGPAGCVPNELGRVLEQQRRRQTAWEQLFLATADMSEEELRKALRSALPEQRFAAYVVGERRLFWHGELIPLLTDPAEPVRQAARRSLVVLSFLALNPKEAAFLASPTRDKPPNLLSELTRPGDFGPASGVAKAQQVAAARRWAAWWEGRPRAGNGLAEMSGRVDAAEADLGVVALTSAMLDAAGRRELVDEYRDAKGASYTLALADAAARSSGTSGGRSGMP